MKDSFGFSFFFFTRSVPRFDLASFRSISPFFFVVAYFLVLFVAWPLLATQNTE